MKVTPYTEGSPQLSSVVGDQTTECIQICFYCTCGWER